ncbi:MAG: class I SAM-dependent methyltransferase [Sulfobacillus sp.]
MRPGDQPGQLAAAQRAECPACGKPSERAYSVQDLNQRRTSSTFDFRHCRACGVGWLAPTFSEAELISFYGVTEEGRTVAEVDKNREPDSERRITRLKRLMPVGSLLDVGCGTGHFLHVARAAGYNVEGVEFDARRARWVREQRELRVVAGAFPGAPLSRERYDIVTMWHVIEHLPQPFEALKYAFDLLRPGGVLSLATPNLSSLQAKVFREYWYHQDAPRHLYLFSERGLRRIVESLGFVPLRTIWGSPEHDWAGIEFSTSHWLPRSTLWQRVVRRVARHAARPVAWVEAALGHGGTFEMDIRRP